MTENANVARPDTVVLKPEHVEAFSAITKRQLDLQARQASVQEFMKTVVQSSEARLSELQVAAQGLHDDTRKLWIKLKAEYGLDLDHVNYDLSEDGTALKPVMLKL